MSQDVLLHSQYGEECLIVKKGTMIGEHETKYDGVFVTDRVMLEIIMGVVEAIEKSRSDREYRF